MRIGLAVCAPSVQHFCTLCPSTRHLDRHAGSSLFVLLVAFWHLSKGHTVPTNAVNMSRCMCGRCAERGAPPPSSPGAGSHNRAYPHAARARPSGPGPGAAVLRGPWNALAGAPVRAAAQTALVPGPTGSRTPLTLRPSRESGGGGQGA